MTNNPRIIGGGFKKVLYTLNTVKRIGVLDSAKALSSKNACKTCGLGMGGQQGGMTNELGEFPSVCNKSVQAQLTDIQAAIPEPIFKHSISELQELTGREMESLGRLDFPIYKPANANRFYKMDWSDALATASDRLTVTSPKRSFFYSSGRSSNEAGFLFQLLARMYGTNHINNCSYYCHQASGEGLGTTIGQGTATIELADLGKADLIFLIGANPSSNHPRFIHQLKNCRERGGRVIVINPAREPGLVRFAIPKSAKSLLLGGHWIASEYLQPKVGSDLALLKGIAKALIESDALDSDFVAAHTNNIDAYLRDIQQTGWQQIETLCGISKNHIERVAHQYAKADKVVFAWGMGVTHHTNGVANVEAIANLAMLRGMTGKPGAGLLPLRGHSNVQGIGRVGVKPVLADDIYERLETEFTITLERSKGMDTMACLQAAHRGEMDIAVIMGGNLYSASPDTRWTDRALDNIHCKLYLTTTLNQGHIHGCQRSEVLIFPVTARDEEWCPTTQESMFNYVRLSDGGIKRLEGVRPEVVILADLAKAILPDSPLDFELFKKHQTIREAIANIIPAMQALRDIEQSKQEFHVENCLLHKPVFNTTDGHANFVVNVLPELSVAKQQFRLTTVRSEGQFNSIIYEEHDSYRDIPQRWSVMMNKDDMQELGLSKEDQLTLRSEHGKMENVTVYPFDIPVGNLMAYYPEANVLVGQQVDPRSKTPAFKSVVVDIDLPG